ncbi:LabA-like NYN domain-containing protein [Terrihabitans sp. B22-R8]|uniref:LabA-like NYN domain-containing protein n=1 Tax=Terrihabitans sp. B22-R8 TaxID=3425128 RepID=UPI00403C3841
MNQMPRIALFIDGANFYSTAKALGFDVDYRKLLKEFGTYGSMVRAYYYTAMAEDQEYSSLRPLVDWLDYNGYTVVTKPTKEYIDCVTGRRKFKGNMDVELTVDALELADRLDHVFLFSGDSDFQALIAALQRKAVRVSVVSTVTTQPSMAADCLRRQADEFLDLADLASKIGRPQADRGTAEPRIDRLPRFIRGPAEGDVDA